MLRRLGVKVDNATSTNEAFEMLRLDHYDLIISDIAHTTLLSLPYCQKEAPLNDLRYAAALKRGFDSPHPRLDHRLGKWRLGASAAKRGKGSLYRQLLFCHLFTGCDGASACNPARTPPVEPARPQATPLYSICCARPCIDAGAVRG